MNQIDIFDLKRMGNEAQSIPSWIGSQYANNVLQSIVHYHRGLSRLEGKGELSKIWLYLENLAQKHGKIAVVKQGGRLVPVEATNAILNGYYEYEKMKAVIGHNAKGESIEVEFDNSSSDPNKRFIVLENNIDQLPDRTGIGFYLDKLVYLLDAIYHDVELSKKNIIFILPEHPNDEDWWHNLRIFNKKIFSYITFEKSQNPDQEQIKKGKQGIAPYDIKYEIYGL